MFGIMIRTTCVLLISLSLCAAVFAQEEDPAQRINQAVFNKVEYHFNQQETDSIYALGSSKFKQSLSLQAFQTVMTQQLYPLGQIQSAELKTYEKGAGIYKLNFISTPLQLVLGLDSLNKIDVFLFQPYAGDPVPEKTVPVESSNTAASEFDRYVDSVALSYSRKGHTHALAIGIINAGKTSAFYYGETEKGNKQLPDENTLFEIGSISKTFTATLLAYLAQTQQVNLDDSITNYLPDSVAVNPDLQRITLRQLANHTSGLPRMPDNIDATAAGHSLNPYSGYTKAHLYTYLKSYKATVPPDSIYQYSNLGFGILGDILSTIYGKPYDEMIQEIICQPLGLKNTTEHPNPDSQYVAKGYNEKGIETPLWTFDAFTAHGSLKSTVSDLLLYAKAHFKMPETDLEHALALTRQFTYFNPPETDIGLAWHMNVVGDELIYWHNGGTFGSSSYLALTPDKKMAIVVLSNTAESVDSVALAILKYMLK
ncbi:CubicO group peptidase, beta-lactamase class C family [Parapedobacter indicus]|uniref:Beta-lactamase n=2 Tax=Parapedobacter indicus TaxID=1477437 RepID=A0A1I3SR04_9SPHI|nr:CubicO group peptidase (beta-lactamase class C family) [Parapedobacter indicus]SFJ61234.1 CubicO group peptidase, beta-lactamase class C family [Parapedobacter indicus]